jgi:hypothetical protein
MGGLSASEVLKAAGVYDPRKLLEVTALDAVHANTFVAQVSSSCTKTCTFCSSRGDVYCCIW